MTDRKAFIQGLRACADFFEQHPTVNTPYCETINVFVGTRDGMAAHARASTWEKVYSDSWFMLCKEFGGGVTLEINTSRETVCRRIVTGTEVVPAQPERVVEKVEWICEDAALLAETV